MLVNVPLMLDGPQNIRELGGYETASGGCTKNGVFLRGDSTHTLTVRDLEALRNLGVTLVYALTTRSECLSIKIYWP